VSIEVFLTVCFALAMTINLVNVFYRIITEKDPEKSWKEDAILSLLAAIVQGAILTWMYLSWWI